MTLWRNLVVALVAAFVLTACGGSSSTDTAMPTPDPEPEPTEQETCEGDGGRWNADMTCTSAGDLVIEMALAKIAAATTAADAQAAYDEVKADVSASDGDRLQAAVNARIAALATMGRADTQRTALMTAAGNIDTSDLSTQASVDAAEAAIAALKAAIAAAVDVDDTSMYQAQVTAAETLVAAAQSTLDHAAQTAVLTSALTDLQAINLTDLSTQENIDAAQAAIDALQGALDAATELSAAEKTAAMTELATANRTVMTAQGNFDTDAQKTALASAVATLAGLDLDNLMTQEQIDAAVAAITGVNSALAAATNLTDAEKLDATVDVTVAQRKVDRAETTLAENVGNQRTTLMTAGTALAAIDLDDLDTAEKIAAAQTAVDNLKAALDGATHLSDSEKATYQTQLSTATETVRMADTGLNRAQRMIAQRSAITSAVTMARTAVAGVNDDSTDSEVSAADSAIAALKAAIDGADDLPEGDADVASAQGTLTTLEGQLASAKTSRTAALEDKAKADRTANAKLGKALRAALGGPDTAPPTYALANIGQPTLDADGLEVDAATGAGALATTAGDPPSVTLEAGASARSLDGWAGTDYALTTGTGDTMVTNEARVYTNQGPRTQVSFADAGITVFTGDTAGNDRKGYVTLDETDATTLGRIRGAAFEHSGTQTYEPASEADAVYLSGTFAGAPGRYRCTGTCTVQNDGEDGPGALGGVWHFRPDAGVNAMTHQPDAHYLYYGWWVRKDSDDMPTAASAFSGRVGNETDVSTDGLNPGWTGAYTAGTTLTGSATYEGNAAGKYAIDNVLDGTGHGGHFTADAMLEATFSGDADDVGITGTIDNFRLNDRSEDAGWSVSLHQATFGEGGEITAPADDTGTADVNEGLGTTWSINGNKALATGTWSGDMYDEAVTGDADDGSNLPTTVTGTFYSEFSTIGRMVGAFGAEKE